MDMTKIYDLNDFEQGLTKKTIKEVYDILKEKGYNPINQIVGYFMSGDPGYITSYKNARNMIMKLDRSKILEVLIKDFIKWDI